MPTAIREATDGDRSVIVGLIREGFRDVAERFELTRDNCPTHPSHCTLEWVVSAAAKGVKFLILEYKGRPRGCVALERASPEVRYLERLAVLPAWRGRGWGTALLRRALDEARERGGQRVEIGIIAEHTELRDWYVRRGFSIKETRRFEHLPFTVTFMYIDL